MEKKLATQRVFGRDSRGREVLVAAPGQPIDEKRFQVEGSAPTTDAAEAKGAEERVEAEAKAAVEKEKSGSRKGK